MNEAKLLDAIDRFRAACTKLQLDIGEITFQMAPRDETREFLYICEQNIRIAGSTLKRLEERIKRGKEL